MRVRRDANEQAVLAAVTRRLQPLVSTLSVQVLKDAEAIAHDAPAQSTHAHTG